MTAAAQHPDVSDEESAPTRRQILIVFAGLMLGVTLASLDQTIVATALPSILSDIGGGTHLSWVVTAYLVTATASTPLYGKVSDLYGRKNLFQTAIVLFVAGSVLCGLSQNLGELVAFRALQGFGAGGLISVALTIIGDIISARDRARYQGFFGAIFGLSSVAGPLIGGFFTDSLTWRWIFFINLPLGLLAFTITAVVLKLPRVRRETTIDYAGAVTLVTSMSALLVAAVWGGQEYAWGSATIVGLLVAAATLLTAFVVIERRAAEPILPPRLFASRAFVITSVATFMVGVVMFGVIVYLAEYLQVTRGSSATMSGVQTIPLMAGVFVASIWSGRIITRIGRYQGVIAGGMLAIVVGLAFLSTVDAQTSFGLLSLYMAFIGLGLGCSMNLTLAIQNAVHYRDLGAGSAAATFFRSLGGAIGVAVLGAVFSARVTRELASVPGSESVRGSNFQVDAVQHLQGGVRRGVMHAFANAVDVTFWVATGFAVLGLVCTLTMREIALAKRSGLQSAQDERRAAADVSTEPV